VDAVVIDVGSGMCKAGYAGDDAPCVVFPCVVGHPKNHLSGNGNGAAEYYVGDEAYAKRDMLNLKYPMDHGIVSNWDDMEKIYERVFRNELKVPPEQRPVFLSEVPLNPKTNRELMTETMFEKLHVPAIFIHNAPTLVLCAAGRTTGCVIDCGDSVSYCAPVYDGYLLYHAIERRNWGGRDIIEVMRRRLLTERGFHFDTSGRDREIVRDIKEKHGYIAMDYETELANARADPNYPITYELPDATTINIGDERFACPEALFTPSIIDRHDTGIHQCAFQSINKCHIETRKDLYANVMLSGGATLFNGIAERLTKELTTLAPPSIEVKVIARPERKYSVWIGGSIVAALASFQPSWVKKADYEEYGPTIVHKKCLS
jgi:actin-related protein